MIIGINGKIGSGKDTIGSIIQYLTANDVGSDCIKRVRGGLSVYGYHNSKWEVKKFAGKLKIIASILTGIPIEKFEDQEFKKTILGEEWGIVKDHPMNHIPVFEDVKFNHLMSVRELLQKLGTEAMRDGLHQNVWVNALMCDYRRPKMSEPNPSNWVITDVRFPNELAAVNDVNGLTIRVVRPQIETANFKPQHPSETALDDAEFDYEIINDGSLEDLIAKVRQILITEKII